MDKKYNHKEHEERIYKMWERKGFFKANKKGAPYTVLMPPPNANGSLHAGHAMYSVDDILIRFKRMQGFSALWQPGMDHAGFETQYVYEKELRKKGKSRLDFDRQTLYQNVWDFVKENSGLIYKQFKLLGFSADWERSVFTLDNHVTEYVCETFKKMHEDGYIYRDGYIVNYCTYCGTSLADLEVKHIERKDTLYFIKYPLATKAKNDPEYIEVATVRPEPIFSDTHLAIHPANPKTKWLKGKTVINPITGSEMTIIEDEFVDPDFGTGIVKLTPAHDATDFAVAKKHNLPIISAIDTRGRMIDGPYKGEKVLSARENTVKDLTEKDLINLEKTNSDYEHSVIVCYKCGHDLEPLTIPNWFIKVDKLKEKAKMAVEKDEVVFFPKRFKKHMLQWLDIMHDWPISRQIVWGIRIPAYYDVVKNPELTVTFLKNGQTITGLIKDLVKDYSLKDIKEGLQNITAPDDAIYTISLTEPEGEYLQETDTFDTWFSSGQWPLVTLHDLPDRIPTDMIGTLSDILKFWISRMILFTLYREDKIPYKEVYLWSMVADEKGVKMSKSKGNVVNPIDLVDKYGADAVRMSLVFGVAPGAKVILSEDKVRGMRNFANKIWNIARFINLMTETYEKEADMKVPSYSQDLQITKEDKQILSKLNKTIKTVNQSLDNYRFADAAESIYHFLWDDLANDYLQSIKNLDDKRTALSVLTYTYTNAISLLHPFMPFVTEAIWEHINVENKVPLIVTSYPKA